MTTVLWIIVLLNVIGALLARKTLQRVNNAAVVALALTLLLGAPAPAQAFAAAVLVCTILFRLYVAAIDRWDP